MLSGCQNPDEVQDGEILDSEIQAVGPTYVGFWNDDRVWNPGEYAIHNGEVWLCAAQTTAGSGQSPGTSQEHWDEPAVSAEARLFVTPEIVAAIPNFSPDKLWRLGAIVRAEDGKYYLKIVRDGDDGSVSGNAESPLDDDFGWGHWELIYDPANPPADLSQVAPVGYWNSAVQWDYTIRDGGVWKNDQLICDERDLLNHVTLPRWHYERVWPEGALIRYDGKVFKSNGEIDKSNTELPSVSNKWTDITSDFNSMVASAYKDLTVYFTQWGGQSVKDLPWDRVTTINHAFWKILPDTFKIVTIDPDPAVDEAHFKAYAEMIVQYPNVDVLIAIGGWTKSGYFSEMVSTPQNRAKFIDSCIAVMDAYPWLGGIDIDWEYPGVPRDGDGMGGDEGNPAAPEDGMNYTLLLQELRAAMNSRGHSDKKLTVCAPANPYYIVTNDGQVNQELVKIAAVVDRINIMTYDITGGFDKKTGHHSNLYCTDTTDLSVKHIVDYFIETGVAKEKINIGTPLYSRGWNNVSADSALAALGAPGGGGAPEYHWHQLKRLEVSDGYETGYDETAEAAYIYSIERQQFFSYENERSLSAKLNYIANEGLGGLIVWETNGDNINWRFPMLSQMAIGLGIWSGEISDYAPQPMPPYHLGFWNDDRTWYPGDHAILNGKVWECAAPTTIGGGERPGTNWGYWTGPGVWNAEQPIGDEEDLMQLVSIPAWMDSRAYTAGALAAWQGKVYVCITNTNIGGQNPATDTDGWELTVFVLP